MFDRYEAIRVAQREYMHSMIKSRYDIMWGRSFKQISDDYIASGEAKKRKDGGWDMRYKASRYVHSVESNKGGILA